MKSSAYNLFFKTLVGPDFLGYNSFTNALVEFSPEDYKVAKKILSFPHRSLYKGKEIDIWRMLEQGGFLVSSDSDYLKELKQRYFGNTKVSNDLSLTIAPTLKCNFRCIYCFENKRKESMSAKTQKDLLKFVTDNLPKKGILNITWFGGEPLLALSTIEFLSKQMNRICKEKKAKYNNDCIITNGYLLSAENAKKLKDLGITTAQITLDGPPEIHNKRRPLANGRGTFQVVLDNIKTSSNILRIKVRVNIDKSNLDAIHLLQQLFDENEIQKVHIYPGHVQAFTQACKNIAPMCMSDKEFIKYNWEFELFQLSKGRYIPDYPVLRYGFCIATNPNGFVVAPSGALFKCWNEIAFSEKFSVGSVPGKTTKEIQENLEKWNNWSPFDNKRCVKCKYLPLCMGGCPYTAMTFHRLDCSRYKKYLEEIIAMRHALGRIYDVNKVLNNTGNS